MHKNCKMDFTLQQKTSVWNIPLVYDYMVLHYIKIDSIVGVSRKSQITIKKECLQNKQFLIFSSLKYKHANFYC